jgi:hypothetical protein
VEQLFDLKADPMEESDLAAAPDRKEHLAAMREESKQLKKAAK